MKKAISILLSIITVFSIGILSTGCAVKDWLDSSFDEIFNDLDKVLESEKYVSGNPTNGDNGSSNFSFNPSNPNLAVFKPLEVGDVLYNGQKFYIGELPQEAIDYINEDTSGVPILGFTGRSEVDGSNFYVLFDLAKIEINVGGSSSEKITFIDFSSQINCIDFDFTALSDGKITISEMAVDQVFSNTAFFESCPLYIKRDNLALRNVVVGDDIGGKRVYLGKFSEKVEDYIFKDTDTIIFDLFAINETLGAELTIWIDDGYVKFSIGVDGEFFTYKQKYVVGLDSFVVDLETLSLGKFTNAFWEVRSVHYDSAYFSSNPFYIKD